MNPKTNPKTELTLSAGPELDRWIARARNGIFATVVIAILIFVGGLSSVNAAPDPWPCLIPGWHPGDVYGPGPDDIVPDVGPCETQEPQPSGEPVSRSMGRPLLVAPPAIPPPAGGATLPPTDTAP